MVSWTSQTHFDNASSDHVGLLAPGVRAKFAAACCLTLALLAANCGGDAPPTDQPTDIEPPAIEAPSQTTDAAPAPSGDAPAVLDDEPPPELPADAESEGDISPFARLPGIEPRLLHTATLLEDGTVLLVGGAGFHTLNPDVKRFHPADQSMRPAAALLELRQTHEAARLSDGRVLVIGGVTTSGRIVSTEIYDPVADTFVPGPPLPRARSALSSVRLADGRVLVTGGNRQDPPAQVLEVYDPAQNRFLDAGLLPDEMGAVRLVRLADDRVLAVSPALAAIIDPVTFALDLLTPANGLLLEGFADAEPAWPQVPTLLADGTVLLTGGCCDADGLVLDDAAIFDPERRARSPRSER